MCQTYFKVLVSNHKLDKSTAKFQSFPPAAAGTLERRSDPDFDDMPPGVNIQKDVEPPWGNPFGKVIYNGGFSTSILVYQGVLAKVHDAGDGNIWMRRHDPGRERKTQRGSI